MKILATTVIALAALGVSACATQPEPCTAAWVDWKTERIYADFSRTHREEFQALRDLGSILSGQGGGLAGLATLAQIGPGVVSMVNTFASDTVPQIQSAVGQCGTAPNAAKLFADLLRREGVGDNAATFIERLGLMLESAA